MSENMNRRDFGRLAAAVLGLGVIEHVASPVAAFAQQAAAQTTPAPAADPAEQPGISVGTWVISFPGAPVQVRQAAGPAGGTTANPQQPQNGKKGGPSILNPFGGLRKKKDNSTPDAPAGQPSGGAAPTYVAGPSNGPKLEYQFFIINDGSAKYYLFPTAANMAAPAGSLEDPGADFSLDLGVNLRVVAADANGYKSLKTKFGAQELDVITPTDSSGRSLALTTAMILDVANAINEGNIKANWQDHFLNAATGALAVPLGICTPTDCSNLANLHAGKGTTVLGLDSTLPVKPDPYFVPMIQANEQEIQAAKEAAAKAKASAPKTAAPARKGTTATKTPAAAPVAAVEIPAPLTAGDLIAGFSALPKGAPLPKPGAKPPGLVIK